MGDRPADPYRCEYGFHHVVPSLAAECTVHAPPTYDDSE